MAFDPDRVTVVDGQPACPHCGAPMKVVDMFGIADAFAEDEPEEMTLDDLVPGDHEPRTRPEAGPAPSSRPSQTAHSGSRMHRAVSREDKEQLTPTPAHPPSSDSLPARVPRPEDDGGGARTAMDVMREMRGRKKR
jgi:hypothetical protein